MWLATTLCESSLGGDWEQRLTMPQNGEPDVLTL